MYYFYFHITKVIIWNFEIIHQSTIHFANKFDEILINKKILNTNFRCPLHILKILNKHFEWVGTMKIIFRHIVIYRYYKQYVIYYN